MSDEVQEVDEDEFDVVMGSPQSCYGNLCHMPVEVVLKQVSEYEFADRENVEAKTCIFMCANHYQQMKATAEGLRNAS